MKLVKFNRQMAPHAAADTRAVPDAVADQLVAAGAATVQSSVFDGAPSDGEAQAQPQRRRDRTRSVF